MNNEENLSEQLFDTRYKASILHNSIIARRFRLLPPLYSIRDQAEELLAF